MITLFSILKKAFLYKNGALSFISFSCGGFISIVSDEIMSEVAIRDLIIPMVITLIGMIMYFCFFFLELYTGIVSIKKKYGKKWNKEKEVYKRIWKALGVSFLMIFMMFFMIASVVVKNELLYYPVAFLSYSIIMLVVLFEFQMVGNNIQSYAPPKPGIFIFMDRVLDLAQLKILSKLNDNFCPVDEEDIKRLTQEPPKEEDPEF